jgi:hypothetical protein
MKAIWSMAVLCTACAVNPADEEVESVQQDVTSYNGTSLNGTSLNGTSLNGTSLNGTSLNGTSLNGTSLNGTSLNGTSLNGTSLVGSTWTGAASNGATVPLRIDSAVQGPAPNDDVWFYGVSYQTADGTWSPLCGADTEGEAIAVPGVWGANATYAPSSTQFTWACRHKTIAKCVELGYKTWNGYATQMASCVRLLRADYCGDGSSYTLNGTLLNLYDNVGVQADTESWDIEAGWTPNGAICAGSSSDTRFKILGLPYPSCYQALKTRTCGFAMGAVLLDEVSPTVDSSTPSTTKASNTQSQNVKSMM